MATLSAMLTWAVRARLIGSNPLRDLQRLRNGEKRKARRSLTVEEVDDLLAASPDDLREIWLLLLSTGLRSGELLAIRPSDVDHEDKTLTVRASTAKTHRARTIPLSDECLSILDRRGDFKPWGQRTLLADFYRCAKLAGIEDARPGGSVDIHALRVSFITLALDNDAKPKAVQEIVGHANLAMTMDVYAKATSQSKRDAVSALPFAQVSRPDHLPTISGHKLPTDDAADTAKKRFRRYL